MVYEPTDVLRNLTTSLTDDEAGTWTGSTKGLKSEQTLSVSCGVWYGVAQE